MREQNSSALSAHIETGYPGVQTHPV
jgi:hypothetical protein